MKRQEKSNVVDALSKKLGQACVVIVAQTYGLDSSQTLRLRRVVRQAGGELKVAKNTLARLAAEGTPYAPLAAMLSGPTALVLGYKDPVSVAKVLVEFSGEVAEKVSIRGGVLEGRSLDAGAVKELAELPPREVVLGSLLGLIQAPAAQLLRTIQEPGARFVRLLDRLRSELSVP